MMKILDILFLLIIGIFSCSTKKIESELNKSDTLQSEFSHYINDKFIGSEYETVIKKVNGDSTYFSYYDTSMTDLFLEVKILNFGNQQFEILNQEDLNWIHVKDFMVFDSLFLKKYEIENPPLDGDEIYFVSSEFGVLGLSSWRNRILIKKWGNINFQDTLQMLLSTDSLMFPYSIQLEGEKM